MPARPTPGAACSHGSTTAFGILQQRQAASDFTVFFRPSPHHRRRPWLLRSPPYDSTHQTSSRITGVSTNLTSLSSGPGSASPRVAGRATKAGGASRSQCSCCFKSLMALSSKRRLFSLGSGRRRPVKVNDQCCRLLALRLPLVAYNKCTTLTGAT